MQHRSAPENQGRFFVYMHKLFFKMFNSQITQVIMNMVDIQRVNQQNTFAWLKLQGWSGKSLLTCLSANKYRGGQDMESTIHRNTPPEQLPLFLTTNEAAILLGCSTALVRALCSSKALPSKKVGRAFKIFRGTLLDFITHDGKETNPGHYSRSA
jgi:excisionase family DNA binding protein